MSWDGITRRSSDNGREPPEVILARIDENITFLKTGANEVKKKLEKHEEEDEKQFSDINKTMWTVGGAVSVIVFIIVNFKH